MNCWICGASANSGEHMIKASDLKSLFRHVDQRSPLYLHTGLRRNLAVQGIKSSLLKHQARLCARCNNERTQPHDRAWSTLSQYLQTRRPPIRPGMRVRLGDIFPGKVSQSMLAVHLYFLKLFGCIATDRCIPLPIGEFASAIRDGNPHPNIWISVGTSSSAKKLSRLDARRFRPQCAMVELHLPYGHITLGMWTSTSCSPCQAKTEEDLLMHGIRFVQIRY